MRFTRRLPERARTVTLALAAASLAGVAAASCGGSDRDGDMGSRDTTPEASLPPPSSPDDAGYEDVTKPDGRGLDIERSDAGPLPVVCASSPCATALTTMLGAEGFCALLSDETVACWGQNGNGELGRGGADSNDSPTPARVPDLTGIVALEHTCAIDANGAVWCWGRGPYLRGDTATTVERTPVKLEIPPVKKLGVAAETACALFDDGVRCWGANTNGQLAPFDPATDPSSALPPQEVAIPAGSKVNSLAVGRAALALRADGTALSWGANPPLGRVSAFSPDPYPAALTLGGVMSIDVSGDSACALVEGIAYCWGGPIYIDGYSQIRPPPERRLPELVRTPEPVVQIATTYSMEEDLATGAPPLPQRACAVSVSGAVFCWGANWSGQAGDGTSSYAYEPVRVVELAGPVAQVKTTPKATCALLTSGKVQCWGDGFSGQLGRGKLGAPSFVPQEVFLP